MILIDTSTIVAWLDASHPDHPSATVAIARALTDDDVAISVVTLSGLAAGGSSREAMDSDLVGMHRVEVTEDDAWAAGLVYSRTPRPLRVPLPDYFIRAQASERGWKHLTNDRRRTGWWPGLDFIFGN